jgi:serine/threonine protein kinase
VRSVEEALLEQQARRQDATGGQAAYQKTVQFDAHKIGRPVQPGELVPGYRVERLIGEGGMAKVYLALRTHDGAQVALKVLDPRLQADETFLRRFVREYKMLASLDNEHVARVFDQGFSGEHPFIAMEYFPGGTLAARIHQGLTSLGAVRVAAQLARALDAVHAVGIVHRDLKPANILFRQNGRLAIVDFGLAKPAGITSTLTRVGEVLATPRYMSPEQCSGREVDARSDLYSLGVILYEMLTGSKLWGTAPPARMIELHLEGQVPRLGGRLAGYQSILDRLLAKEPGARYQSARELFAAIAV